jgi:uncharacterized membrane protein YhiD involved in acid resistance
MPEWLHNSFKGDTDILIWDLVIRLTVALVLGCVVAGIYRLTHGKSLGLLATLVLLTVLIAMVTLVIGNRANSIALAFSLVGALGIVRFRTIVEDTRDTAFVIFAVVVGMAAGAGYLDMAVAIVGIPIVTLAAFLFRPRGALAVRGRVEKSLVLRVGFSQQPEMLFQEVFNKHLERYRLIATTTARQGAALELTYAVRLRKDETAIALVSELNRIEGMQGVELRQS